MKKKISIKGMSCAHCVNNVVQELDSLGAENINVSLEKNHAIVEINGDVSDDAINGAIEEPGNVVTKIEKA
ncbi:MAG: copper chaperone CopZ [Clostridium sp.]|jgi:copper chaperone CopZ